MTRADASHPVKGKRSWPVPAGIFLLALLLRLLYLWDISDNPFFTDLIIDLKAYDDWAKEIAGGNWLGDKVFYQSPLYPYFLGLIYWAFGRSLLLIYIIQAFLGAADCLLIYGIGKESFNRRVGIIAGLGAALYKVSIFYQALILKTFLGLLLIDLSLLFLLLCIRKDKAWLTWLFAGISLGLAALVRDNVLALIPFFALWLFFSQIKQPVISRLKPVLTWSMGLILVLGLSLARNYYVSKDWVITTSQGGQNFYMGNHRDNYWGTYKAPEFVRANPEFEEKDFRKEAEDRTGRKDLRPSELSSYWYGQAFREIRDDPRLFTARLFRKTLLFFNHQEVPDNLNYYLFRTRFSILLKFPLLNFAVVAPVGLLGLALCLRFRKAGLLLIYFFVYSGTVILFFVMGRYRLAVAGPLLVFGAYGILWMWERLRSRQFRESLPGIFILVLFIIFTEIPLHKPSYGTAFYNLGNAYARQGRWAKAYEAYKESLNDDPDNIHTLINTGKALMELGDSSQAAQLLEKAVKIDPEYVPARLNLGIALYKLNKIRPAMSHFMEAAEKDPENITALLYLAEISAKTGSPDAAEGYYKSVLEIDRENRAAKDGLRLLKK